MRNLLNKLTRQGRSAKSISLTRTVLSSCLNEAVIDELITSNPVMGVKQNKKRSGGNIVRNSKGQRINPYSEDEVRDFLTTAKNYSPEVYGPMFLFGFRTGMRLGELLCINWEDIDWHNKTISVYKSYRKGVLKDSTKTELDRRVDMSDQLCKELRELQARRVGNPTKHGSNGKATGPIFDYKGELRAQNTVRKAFKTIIKLAGLREVRVHDMRHTFASILISKGASLHYIKEQLGHSSIKTTSDLYAHLLPGYQRKTINLLDGPSENSDTNSDE